MNVGTDFSRRSYLARELLIATVLVGSFVYFNCSEGLRMTGDPLEIEGRVEATGSGTVEGPMHFGYVLKDCWWAQQRKGTVTPLYFDGAVDLKYVGKRVRINGKVYSELSVDRLRYFIHVYSLNILDQ